MAIVSLRRRGGESPHHADTILGNALLRDAEATGGAVDGAIAVGRKLMRAFPESAA